MVESGRRRSDLSARQYQMDLINKFPSNERTRTGPLFNPKFKLALCAKFDSNGVCRYHEKCQFAHGKEELEEWTEFSSSGGPSRFAGASRSRNRRGSSVNSTASSTTTSSITARSKSPGPKSARRGSDNANWRSGAGEAVSIPASNTNGRRIRGESLEDYLAQPLKLGNQQKLEFHSDNLTWTFDDPTLEKRKEKQASDDFKAMSRRDDILLPRRPNESKFLRYDSASGTVQQDENSTTAMVDVPRYSLGDQMAGSGFGRFR